MRWDLLIMAFSMFNCITVPVKVAFDPKELESPFYETLNYFIDSFFFMDILVSFRTIIYDKTNEEVYDALKIAREYLSTTFIIDFLATFPFDLFVNN